MDVCCAHFRRFDLPSKPRQGGASVPFCDGVDCAQGGWPARGCLRTGSIRESGPARFDLRLDGRGDECRSVCRSQNVPWSCRDGLLVCPDVNRACLDVEPIDTGTVKNGHVYTRPPCTASTRNPTTRIPTTRIPTAITGVVRPLRLVVTDAAAVRETTDRPMALQAAAALVASAAWAAEGAADTRVAILDTRVDILDTAGTMQTAVLGDTVEALLLRDTVEVLLLLRDTVVLLLLRDTWRSCYC
ncbi:hypothetical protein VTK73DRAFT_5930 [Phialemonium thermophilum]|uniref:Uncharacterized protein n=1 Tax=Phialemonium thermophilum TaxID=223376 RepID=A0ABR3V094_9PEZI